LTFAKDFAGFSRDEVLLKFLSTQLEHFLFAKAVIQIYGS